MLAALALVPAGYIPGRYGAGPMKPGRWIVGALCAASLLLASCATYVAEIVKKWYARSQAAASKIETAADAAVFCSFPLTFKE